MDRVITIVTAILISLILIGASIVISHRKSEDMLPEATESAEVKPTPPTPPPPPPPNEGDEVPAGSTKMELEPKDEETTQVRVSTNQGEFTLELFPTQAPNTVANFVAKANSGFYEGLTFHRVEDWVVQGGDPLGNGTGGGQMPTELSEVAFEEGSLGVARGQDMAVSNDSQFFVCTADCSWLTGQYTNFGKVTAGMEVVKQLKIGAIIHKIAVIQ